MSDYTIHVGDCRELMADMEAETMDAVVTDPPAGISFMGKDWDADKGGRDEWIAWLADVLAECRRLLKPGGHAVVWALPRTSGWTHRSIEDAGFEVRDCVAHLFGSGFPKALNLDGGLGTALKPAAEFWYLARKPLIGTVASNVEAHGTGALNIDGCRIGFAGPSDERESKQKNRHGDFDSGPRNTGGEGRLYGEDHRRGVERGNYDPPGRWPANVVLGCACEGEAHDEGCAVRMLDEQTGERSSHTGTGFAAQGAFPIQNPTPVSYADSGGASRFLYCAKASRAERERGLEGMEVKRNVGTMQGDADGSLKTGAGNERDRTARNFHPTVKPVDLMRWLVRLVTPPGGVVLDPFTGSGTTGMACTLEGFDFVGIEQDAEYAEIARKRIHNTQPSLFSAVNE